MSLADQSCVPCRGDVAPLEREHMAPLLAQIDAAWDAVDVPNERRGHVTLLRRSFRFGDFKSAMAFAGCVGEVAEEQHHHPDLHVAWGKTVVEIWTHKIGGLTPSDFVFAAKCDGLYSTSLSRPVVTS